ncbi:hypothetical protein C0Z18_23110 [Trinickia dabaoshanensis]|uniref:TniQ domain-containing protein n=1 Tax=Trinickia dabaoshanensis TaxID=564714 RepID=A0A2N7VH33_9BURK|nr:TniQ family protein [Trinickia dabaoshanensis]PMS16463.1 hypothetical protein C0Z18_23110 [Trinickia dabaoshanensis]
MFPSSTAPYPRQDEIDADEDGVGFALRMATRNGITFNELARQLASPGHLYLPSQSVGAIALMFGCTPIRLHRAFVQRYFRGESYGAQFLGHEFQRPYFLRQTRPQICPACLRERTRALAAWSICLITACPFHGIRLLDRCSCGRPVCWRRLSVEFCECGRLLTDRNQRIKQADPRELVISSQAMYLLGSNHFRLRPDDAMFGVFDGISIDTFLRLIWVFGIVTEGERAPRAGCISRILPTSDASTVCCRAFDRLARVIGATKNVVEIDVHQTALEALRLDCISRPDIQLVESLAARLKCNSRRGGTSIRQPNRQFSLFEECND